MIAWCEAHGQTMILDGTELGVQKAKDQVEQRKCYSGKKKRHTYKTIGVADAHRNLLWLTPPSPGSIHEITLMRDAGLVEKLAKLELDILYDLGAQGLQHEIDGLIIPTKKPRGGLMSDVAKFFNRVLASERVYVEHWSMAREAQASLEPRVGCETESLEDHRSLQADPALCRDRALHLLGADQLPTGLADQVRWAVRLKLRSTLLGSLRQ